MHRTHLLLAPVILLALFQSCAGRAVRQVESGGPGTETIAIVGTNDLHGALLPLKFQSRASAGEPSVAYEAGGAAMLASYLKALREEWGGNMLWLDAGDALTGTLESEVDQGASMIAFLNQNGLDAAAVGENDLRLEALQARVSEARFPYLAVNLRDSATGKPAELAGVLPSRILKAGGLNIGVIGIAGGRSAVQPSRSAERASLGGKLRAGPAPDAVAAEAKRLRDSGAHLVIGLAHAGAACEPGSAPVSHFIRKASDPLGACSRQSQLVQLLSKLPAGTLDAVVSGRSHRITHHWIRGVPVLQGGGSGLYFNVLYLTYDWNRRAVIAERTRIEGPVPVCPKVFRAQKDCHGLREPPMGGRGSLVAPDFHGKRLDPDPESGLIVVRASDQALPASGEAVAKAARAIDLSGPGESGMGNLAADAARTIARADVAIVGAGAARISLPSGQISYGDLFRAVPYDSRIVLVELSGDELTLLSRILVNGSKPVPFVSGLELRVLERTAETKGKDLDGDRRIAPWEVDRLLEAKLDGGRKLEPRKLYRVATLDYLAEGGDDLAWFFARVPESRFQRQPGPRLRDAVRARLTELARSGPVNSLSAPLVALSDPRYRFEKRRPKAAPARKKRRK